MSPSSASHDVVIALPDSAATEMLGARLAGTLRPGDAVCLFGDLGAGKTTLARGLVRAAAGGGAGDDFDVPSPTYTLVQTYRAEGFELWHVDLYRLERVEEALELGLEDALETAVVVMEWPERLGGLLPEDRLEVHLADAEGGGRSARLVGRGAWRERISDI